MIDGPLPAPAHDEKYFQYDRYGRKTLEVGELAPNGLRLAKKFEYRDSDDKLVLETSGTVTCQVDCDQQVLTLTVINRTATDYDGRRYPVRETAYKSTTNYTITDRSFLDRGLAECTAVRMNVTAPVAEGAACTPDTRQNTDGLDRITKNNYDAAGQLTAVQKAFGTPEQVDYAVYTYTPNGKQECVTDANGNKARFLYDGFDRLFQWQFPSKTTPGVVNAADFEQYGYDNNGNRTSLKKRDNSTLVYQYDALNRMYHKGGQTADVFYTFDLADRQLTATFATGGQGITNTYDGFGDLLSTKSDVGGTARTLTSLYDAGGRRTRLTHADGQAFTYAYDNLSRLSGIYQGTDTSIPLDTFVYTTNGLVSRRNEAASAASKVNYTWDDIGRLTSQADIFATTANNVTWAADHYNGASQVTQETRDNNAFAGLLPAAGTTAYQPNGLNQYSQVAGATLGYDANGNLTSDPTAPGGTKTYLYDGENRLTKVTQGGVAVSLIYDPLGRLAQVAGSAIADRTFLYDGDAMVAEYSSGGALQQRWVHGSNAAADDPLVQFDHSGVAAWLHADHLGSIIAVTNPAGGSPTVNRYDEYGSPAATNVGRFQYTGQVWLPEIGLYYYKARMYAPALGRFIQTDPIGYKGGFNLYAYADDDPGNLIDPDGAGPIGWIVRLTAEGFEKVRPLFSKTQAVAARRSEQDVVITTSRQAGGQIERAASGSKANVMRHSAHDLGEGKKGLPHFQTEGRRGHTFYGTLTGIGAILLTGLDYLDRATDPFDGSGLGAGTCPIGGCTTLWTPPEESKDKSGSSSHGDTDDRGRTNQWSSDSGQITGNRAKGTRICPNNDESGPC